MNDQALEQVMPMPAGTNTLPMANSPINEPMMPAPTSNELAQTFSGVEDPSEPLPPKLPGGQRHDSMFNPRKLFVGGVDQDVTQSEFRAFWEKYGELEDCIVISDALTGKNRGFGFVVFKEKAHTDQVLAEAGCFEMNGRRLDIKKAVPRTSRKGSRGGYGSGRYRTTDYGRHSGGWGGPRHDPYFVPDAHYDVRYTPGYDGSTDPRSGSRANGGPVSFGRRGNLGPRSRVSIQGKLFVGQLPEDITKQELGDYFGKFGELSDFVVMFDSAKTSRRFGFVTFADPTVADTVLQSGPHYIPSARPADAPLVVERATPRGEKSRDSGFSHRGTGHSWPSYPPPRYGPPQGYADRAYDPYYAHEHEWYGGGYSRQQYQQPPTQSSGNDPYGYQSSGYGPARPPQQPVGYRPY